MAKRIVGISPWSPKDGTADYKLMQEAGIEWVRAGLAQPYTEVRGETNPQYLADLEKCRKMKEAGMRIAGISPMPDFYNYIPELGRKDFKRLLPEWMGDFATDEFYENVFEMTKKMAEDTRGLVDLWQVANEMDIPWFHGRMTIHQAARYLVACAEGLRAGNPDALLGTNPSKYDSPDGLVLFDECYVKRPELMDYVGVDCYFGTWHPGKVQDMAEVIDILHEKTGKQVLINEWGYNSAGGEAMPGAGGVCVSGHWEYVWRKEHSPEEQAAYVATGTRLLLTYPNCMGFLYYSWGDDGYCQHCGKYGCPGESTWGITDGHNNPKPAYYALKENVLKYNK